jgi:hypothetical protein
MIKLHLAVFSSPMYPEDNNVFGAYLTEQEAQSRCDQELAHARTLCPQHPDMYSKKAECYHTEELELCCTDAELASFVRMRS